MKSWADTVVVVVVVVQVAVVRVHIPDVVVVASRTEPGTIIKRRRVSLTSIPLYYLFNK